MIKIKDGGSSICICPGQVAEFDFPRTEDVRECEGITATVQNHGEAVWLKAVLHPLKIGRPEYPAYTEAKILLPPGLCGRIEIPFSTFDYQHMAGAFLKYVSSLELSTEGSQSGSVILEELSFSKFGDFHVSVQNSSAVGNPGEMVRFTVELENGLDRDRFVTVRECRYGKETVTYHYPASILLPAGDKTILSIDAVIPEQMPAGGMERRSFELIPDGKGSRKQRMELYVASTISHPFLIHTEKGYERLRHALAFDASLQESLERDFGKTASEWHVPMPHTGEGYVYGNETQAPFYKTMIAWKLTGKQEYLDKLIQFIEGFLDDTYGYLATRYSYFQFIESEEEYAKGDFKVHRACGAGWIQEAEFMLKIAQAYDLLYTQPCFTADRHQKMQDCMRYYMGFESWRLTEGDGNNFQIAEAGAALFFAMLLQDYENIERFLEGENGLADLIASAFMDDGSYFEGASNYMMLVAELLFSICNGAENFGVNLKDRFIPAAYDNQVLHAPWAQSSCSDGEGKPFLGMSFRRDQPVHNPIRKIKDCYDSLFLLLTPQGILLSANDSNEKCLVSVMEKAYYLYHDRRYLAITEAAGRKDLLFGRHMAELETLPSGFQSVNNVGNGLAVLRAQVKSGEGCLGFIQAVLKYGQHGGYHGHYDRLSLLSVIRDNRTFHNMEYAWFGYQSFLFKMWVQTSVAHNMVVADGKMQEPTPCKCICFHVEEGFAAVGAQTISRWSDPPYGGQTPYPEVFPEEKCKKEGRFILPPPAPRKQGEIGEYSEPIFQRRLLVLYDGWCFVWDYEEASEEHIFDCFYHPLGETSFEGLSDPKYTSRLDSNPYGAGQFITLCGWYQGDGAVKIITNNTVNENSDNVMEYAKRCELYRLYPTSGEVMIGRYPQSGDTFVCDEMEMGDIVTRHQAMLAGNSKKTVGFHQSGKSARFVTALAIDRGRDGICKIESQGYDSIVIEYDTGRKIRIHIDGMDCRETESLSVKMEKLAE